ncbi:MAG: TAT-variant-translocated molybdopterin oxidoreductase [Phycisphaerales bacterium]|nr:TAT-variant-translocated molybdopterin oxidoreductase [Phycisphaerales bacterium]
MLDQCHSTTKGDKKKPSKAELAQQKRVLQTAGRGQAKVWRSLDEVADTPQFRELIEREFPASASELLSGSRRAFLQFMGATAALAGAATIPGCRRPEQHIMPFSKEVPEEIVPGKPLYYATAMTRPGGGSEGILVETHEGRPTKIEGNPLHPGNQGKSSLWSQAHVMGLYDPDRLKFPMFRNASRGPVEATWEDFRAWTAPNLRNADADQGNGVAIIVDRKTSPTRDAMKAAVLAKWPRATWVSWSAGDRRGPVEGSRLAFGAPMHELYSFSQAKVVVSLDRDFLNPVAESNGLAHAREWAKTRDVQTTKDEMSRLYVVESGFSITGGCADHRLRVAPSRIPAFAVALAKQILSKSQIKGSQALIDAIMGKAVPGGADIDVKTISGTGFVDEVAMDLLDGAKRGHAVVVAGPSMPAEVHALAHAMNAALGSVGTVVKYLPMGEDEAADAMAQLRKVTDDLNSGKIRTVICIGANPVFDAPAEMGFAAAFAKATQSITLSVGASETAAASLWSLNGAHELECWGDAQGIDGTISPIQPMIAPLYGPMDPKLQQPMSEIELLGMLASDDRGQANINGYELVRSTWRKSMGEAGFEKKWRSALHDGIAVGSAKQPATPEIKLDALAKAVAGIELSGVPSGKALDVAFATNALAGGRFGNVPWLQELPQDATRVVWDNPALVSPATAKALGLMDDPSSPYVDGTYPHARMGKIIVDGRSMEMPFWVMPGMADDTVILTIGYGRTACGRVGDGVGFDVGALRSSRSPWLLRGGRIERAPGSYMITSTQNHWSMEGRTSIVRQAGLKWWKKHGDAIIDDGDNIYGTPGKLNFAERMGELSHTPPNISIYKNPYNESAADPVAGAEYSKGQQWAMTIDLGKCTGCGVCTIACQAENNIPSVGKIETAKGRELLWIRVDRYYTGDDINTPEQMLHQPVACVHCENAPCETVCPVNATVHGPEGVNYMTYNRCIGTRYCANNCPYKVRRYNYFDYGVTRFNGDFYGKEILDKVMPDSGLGTTVSGSTAHNKFNVNLVPPRLREKLDQVSRMQKNPDVTVRSRGVMEKCSYCIQRINAARHECRLRDMDKVPDGFFQSACQQACPSDAIVFGDQLDTGSRVHGQRNHGRSYLLLGFINTRPRTSHMARINNPNERIAKSDHDPLEGHGSGHGDDHGGGSHDGPVHAEEKHSDASFRRDRRKVLLDKGYALSLNVLNTVAASFGVNA